MVVSASASASRRSGDIPAALTVAGGRGITRTIVSSAVLAYRAAECMAQCEPSWLGTVYGAKTRL
jgi:hypothetical protein